MLVLARKTNESIMIGDGVRITILEVKGDQVRVGIHAPSAIKVYRAEVYEAIQEENRKAATSTPAALPKLPF